MPSLKSFRKNIIRRKLRTKLRKKSNTKLKKKMLKGGTKVKTISKELRQAAHNQREKMIRRKWKKGLSAPPRSNIAPSIDVRDWQPAPSKPSQIDPLPQLKDKYGINDEEIKINIRYKEYI